MLARGREPCPEAAHLLLCIIALDAVSITHQCYARNFSRLAWPETRINLPSLDARMVLRVAFSTRNTLVAVIEEIFLGGVARQAFKRS